MKKNILPFGNLIHFVFLGIIIFSSSTLSTCTDVSSDPSQSLNAGISGIVYDTSGHRLDSVRIYCLYNFNYYPTAVTKGKTDLFKVSKPDTFGFNLYQNFPNPVQNTTFLRFSLPMTCRIDLSIVDRTNGEKKYSYSDTLRDGLYQLYLNSLVDSLQLHNGPYTYTLMAKSTTGRTYYASKEMFVVSDVGAPNIITGADGIYFFDYKNTFVGDSVAVYSNEFHSIYNVILGKNITLLFERRGYYSLRSDKYLNPNILIHSDVIMIRNNQ